MFVWIVKEWNGEYYEDREVNIVGIYSSANKAIAAITNHGYILQNPETEDVTAQLWQFDETKIEPCKYCELPQCYIEKMKIDEISWYDK